MKQPEVIEVRIWGVRVGALAAERSGRAYAFQYDDAWRKRGIELAPFQMPTAGDNDTFVFPTLNPDTYRGLPGLLADALPDDFGNALIDAWMASRGITADEVTTLDRLAYMGRRGMGALEFHPIYGSSVESAAPLEMRELVEEARRAIRGDLSSAEAAQAALENIIRVGTSAGGARAKAVVAWNPETNELRAGQFDTAPGFEHWLLKFDGVDPLSAELGSARTFGRIEYAYHLMAKAAGVEMSPCRLLEENGRAHFMTRRFDRDDNGKHHMQTLCALRHLDYKRTGTHAYEQLFMTAVELGLGDDALQQLFARTLFNVMASNNDDHTKNFAFLLREGGQWALAPAYDVAFSYRPDSKWTRQHQLSVNGKFDGIEWDDLQTLADRFSIANTRDIFEQVQSATDRWLHFADLAGVPSLDIDRIQARMKAVSLPDPPPRYSR